MRVFVLIFNPGTDNEGIHAEKIGNQNTILMFENEDDATRFSLMLEAQDFPAPAVESIEQSEIEEFCQSAGYDCKLVPEGALVVPPEANVDSPDWDPNQPAEAQPRDDRSTEDVPDAPDSNLSASELEQIRRRLEGLL